MKSSFLPKYERKIVSDRASEVIKSQIFWQIDKNRFELLKKDA
jgi:hypothetical protein